MTFKRISFLKYIEHHLQLNPTADRRDLEMKLKRVLQDHQNGITCHCRDDIWAIGSAFPGNGCFTFLTGEHLPYDDYELHTAHHRSSDRKGQVHIDDLDPDDIHGLFDDEGYKINTDLMKKPGLCLLGTSIKPTQ
ncbi:MAG: hypothetical protein K9I85_15745 [Saprospiraceae bacterium]|nr:hypothetical protein [Saprospiraceae bacterium]